MTEGLLKIAGAVMSPKDVAAAQLEAYNRQDIDAYMAFFTADCVIADVGVGVTENGADAIRHRYANMFQKFPHNRAEIVHRIVLGDKVIDHERVIRSPGGESFEVAAIYTIKAGKIARVDFVKPA
jgi:hypothetical protein